MPLASSYYQTSKIPLSRGSPAAFLCKRKYSNCCTALCGFYSLMWKWDRLSVYVLAPDTNKNVSVVVLLICQTIKIRRSNSTLHVLQAIYIMHAVKNDFFFKLINVNDMFRYSNSDYLQAFEHLILEKAELEYLFGVLFYECFENTI